MLLLLLVLLLNSLLLLRACLLLRPLLPPLPLPAGTDSDKGDFESCSSFAAVRGLLSESLFTPIPIQFLLQALLCSSAAMAAGHMPRKRRSLLAVKVRRDLLGLLSRVIPLTSTSICGILYKHRDPRKQALKQWASSPSLFEHLCAELVSTAGLMFRFHASL